MSAASTKESSHSWRDPCRDELDGCGARLCSACSRIFEMPQPKPAEWCRHHSNERSLRTAVQAQCYICSRSMAKLKLGKSDSHGNVDRSKGTKCSVNPFEIGVEMSQPRELHEGLSLRYQNVQKGFLASLCCIPANISAWIHLLRLATMLNTGTFGSAESASASALEHPYLPMRSRHHAPLHLVKPTATL